MTTGYVIEFAGKGAYAPSGKVEMTTAQVEAHNRELAQAEIEHAKQTGRAIFYLFSREGFTGDVGNWTGEHRWHIRHSRDSWHNMAGKRTDLWFTGPDGKNWHGVNIGDNDIVRCKRVKG